jgi:hypothetical protein
MLYALIRTSCSGPDGVAQDFWHALKLPKRSASTVARIADGTAHLLALSSQLPQYASDITSSTTSANATAFRYSPLSLSSNMSALGRTMTAVFDAQVCIVLLRMEKISSLMSMTRTE